MSDDTSVGDFGGAIGDVASGIIGLFGANQENTAQSNLLNQQEAYNTQMANTVYQRTKADMIAAGYNPIMAVSGAGGDPSPTAPSYDVQNTLATAANSAAQMGQDLSTDNMEKQKQARQQTQQEKQKTIQSESDTHTHRSQAGAAEEGELQAHQRTLQEYENTKQIRANTPATQAEANANTAEAHVREAHARIDQQNVKLDAYTKRFSDVAHGINSARQAGQKPPTLNRVEEHYNAEGEHKGSTHIRNY